MYILPILNSYKITEAIGTQFCSCSIMPQSRPPNCNICAIAPVNYSDSGQFQTLKTIILGGYEKIPTFSVYKWLK